MSDNRYMMRGVSAAKEDVHNAIKNIDKGIFPQAFCKIIPDILGGDPEYCNIMHADGAGTKSSLAYMYWKETGDLSVWKGIAQDAIVMNTDDLLCVGAVLALSDVTRCLFRVRSFQPSSMGQMSFWLSYVKWALVFIPQEVKPLMLVIWSVQSLWTLLSPAA